LTKSNRGTFGQCREQKGRREETKGRGNGEEKANRGPALLEEGKGLEGIYNQEDESNAK